MSVATAWGRMIARCFDPQCPKYPLYGARGIRVCDRWLCRRVFIEDMGPRPEGHSLDRINNDGDYEPNNCRWATAMQQSQNTRVNRKVTFKNETKCLSEWARVTGIYRKTIAKRLDSGWPVEKALTVPVARRNSAIGADHEDRYIQ